CLGSQFQNFRGFAFWPKALLVSIPAKPMEDLAANLERVREQIARAATKVGRDVDEIELVAISKTHPAERVREAHEAGQSLFGESRVQEARVKIPELPSAILESSPVLPEHDFRQIMTARPREPIGREHV